MERSGLSSVPRAHSKWLMLFAASHFLLSQVINVHSCLCPGEWSASHPGRSTTEERTLSTLTVSVPRSWLGRCEKEKICCPCWESNHDLFRSQSRRALKLVFSLSALPRPSSRPFCRTRSKLIPRLQTETCCRSFQTVCRWLRWGTSFGCITLKDNYLVLFYGLLMMVFDI
jgi:hypothetical protein